MRHSWVEDLLGSGLLSRCLNILGSPMCPNNPYRQARWWSVGLSICNPHGPVQPTVGLRSEETRPANTPQSRRGIGRLELPDPLRSRLLRRKLSSLLLEEFQHFAATAPVEPLSRFQLPLQRKDYPRNRAPNKRP